MKELGRKRTTRNLLTSPWMREGASLDSPQEFSIMQQRKMTLWGQAPGALCINTGSLHGWMPSLYAASLILYPYVISTLHEALHQRAVGFLKSKLWFESLARHDWEWRKMLGSETAKPMFPALRAVPGMVAAEQVVEAGQPVPPSTLLHAGSNPRKWAKEENVAVHDKHLPN